VNADSFLISNEFWQMEWVFKGCEPSEPLEKLLKEVGIVIKIVP
jgi:ribosomal protein S16